MCPHFEDDDGVTSFVDYVVMDGIKVNWPRCGVRHCVAALPGIGFKTCQMHHTVENHHNLIHKALFTLAEQLVESLAVPDNVLWNSTPELEHYEAEDVKTVRTRSSGGTELPELTGLGTGVTSGVRERTSVLYFGQGKIFGDEDEGRMETGLRSSE
ncbi:hypothetical protein FKP32DRAFT_1602883 [Trametes sanguinea]|nr:hypothetical protein FKP32DRAFT_1602883 [Trametes sanguinea]